MKFIDISPKDCISLRLDYWIWHEIDPRTKTFPGRPIIAYWSFRVEDPKIDPTKDLLWRIRRNERVWVREADFLLKTGVIKDIL